MSTAPTFEEYMKQVDDMLIRRLGLGSDECYRDMYENGYSAKEAAEEVLKNNGF
jgi:hypothetical protein